MSDKSTSFLSPKFLERINSRPPKHKGILFEIISEGRYLLKGETWADLCKRVVDYSLSLYSGPAIEEDLIKEAELMYELLYDCIAFPAGRTLRIGGTKASERNPESLFNCCFQTVSELEDFCDLFHLSMCSCGVGYSVLKDQVEKLPTFNTEIEVSHYGLWGERDGKEVFNYTSLYPYIKKEETETQFNGWQGQKCKYTIIVGDSKAGWVEALRSYLRIVTSNFNPTEIHFEYNYIRPEGSPLNTWGGYAAGPDGLVRMFDFITKTIKEANGKLRPIHVMDICDYIGAIVVVGGARRAALICLFSPDDEEMINAKAGDSLGYFIDQQGNKVTYSRYEEIETKVKNKEIVWKAADTAHRTMSNNSIVFDSKPSFNQLEDIFTKIRERGEPGFFNREAAKKRRPFMEDGGMNPCSEILISDHGVCNLTTVNMMAFLNEDKALNFPLLETAVRLITRIGLRQTNVTLSLPKWDYVQKRDRLLGVSSTGDMDLLDSLGWKRNSLEHRKLMSIMNEIANEEADRYAFEMRVARPLLVTAKKPEGTISQLPTVSSGIHRSWAPYYIRNIKFASFDPMCKALMELGVPNEPDKTKKNSNRIVFRFPIKTNAKVSAHEESLEDQFMGYIYNQRHYTDHNTSCTLYVGEDEWEQALKLTYEYWDEIIGVTFLPKGKGSYIQAPYEEVTKEEYEEIMKSFPTSLEKLKELVTKYQLEIDREEVTMEDNPDCSTGACPVV